MRENNRLSYRVDIVLCIDVTGSMRPIIDLVKRNALKLYDDIKDAMQKKSKVIDLLRVKVVAFRDYEADEVPMSGSSFFELPADNRELEECVSGLRADGGGDIPEDGLEALAFAIRSAWTSEGDRRRHIVVVWSDAPTHKLRHNQSSPNYPEKMPEDFTELSLWWGDEQNPSIMDQNAKRLLMFTPDVPWWNRIRDEWDNTIHVTTAADEGLKELDYEAVLDAIANSI